ncbi:MAG: hypothetical protein GW946_00680 [Candidatus Pacebacteria bacterium]|nr:hypothetical protein [Candidatus Paceibacterota bacterium]PIR60871.1 MAG: hypothetical protein COU67_00235 [Candidatus Pacebacteria bacterium CG10_big_fil_rev_8_21_14_0_10_44_54]
MKKILTALAFLALSTSTVLAEVTNPAVGTLGADADAAASGATFARYFIILWRALISVGGLAVVVLFLQGGIEWVTSGGDSGKLEKARNRMVQGAIGLFVLVSSFTLIAYISKLFFGQEFQILQLTFPSAIK